MDGAIVVLAVNIAVGAMFVFGHAIIAAANRDQRAALWFSASYVIGLMSPISEFLIPMIGAPALLEWIGFSTFLVALLSISATLSVYHGKRPPWMAMALILAAGLAARAAIWDAQRDTIWYGMAYQLPYVLASVLAVETVLRLAERRPLHLLLAAVYTLTALHFLVKPFIAVAFGSGATAADYTKTTYALLSQASTGILLLVSGIILLLIVAQRAITESLLASETDPLSGLRNRRGFERLAQQLLVRAERSGSAVSAAMLDLDHFKRINDRFGHAFGDQAIIRFAALLRETAPGAAVVARTGGEEFVMLLEGGGAQAMLHAETVRLRAAGDQQAFPSPTVSIGVAERQAGESLAALLRRADLASYRAKQEGRDRVCLADAPIIAEAANVVRLDPRDGRIEPAGKRTAAARQPAFAG